MFLASIVTSADYVRYRFFCSNVIYTSLFFTRRASEMETRTQFLIPESVYWPYLTPYGVTRPQWANNIGEILVWEFCEWLKVNMVQWLYCWSSGISSHILQGWLLLTHAGVKVIIVEMFSLGSIHSGIDPYRSWNVSVSLYNIVPLTS